MVRGKYAVRADNRRDRDALAAAAESAEHTLTRRESEHEKAVSKLQGQVDALTADLAAARQLMDESASPTTVRLRGQLQDARTKIAARDADLRLLGKAMKRFSRRLSMLLARNFNTSSNEMAALVSEALSNTVSSADVRHLHDLVDGPLRVDHLDRALKAGRITGAQADRLAGKRLRDPLLGKAERKGDEEPTYGTQWSSAGDEYGLYLVVKGESEPPVVLAIYDNGAAAEQHASGGADLSVRRWDHLTDYVGSEVAA